MTSRRILWASQIGILVQILIFRLWADVAVAADLQEVVVTGSFGGPDVSATEQVSTQ